MTLQQMKYFAAVADAGSISVAAKGLFAAQSSVSGAVRAVEEHYGITAFLRTSRGVTLTNEGKELLIEFKGILNRLCYLDERYEGRKGDSHSLYVCSQYHICGMDSFVSILTSLEAEAYHLGFRECKTLDVLCQVEKGLADVGIIFFSGQSKGQMMQELRGRGIIFNHLAYKTAHVYICENHPLAGCSQIRIEDIIQYPFITYDRAADADSAYTEAIIPYYLTKRMVSVSGRAAACSLMRFNQGFVVGSGYLTSDSAYRDIRAIPIMDGADLEIGWIVKSSFLLPDIARRFIALVRGEAQGLGSVRSGEADEGGGEAGTGGCSFRQA